MALERSRDAGTGRHTSHLSSRPRNLKMKSLQYHPTASCRTILHRVSFHCYVPPRRTDCELPNFTTSPLARPSFLIQRIEIITQKSPEMTADAEMSCNENPLPLPSDHSRSAATAHRVAGRPQQAAASLFTDRPTAHRTKRRGRNAATNSTAGAAVPTLSAPLETAETSS